MCAFLFSGTVSGFAQGSLTPPPGAPAPTMKTLDQVEPRTPINATNTPGDADSLFKITQPGSYYLTGNVTGVSGKMGIEVAPSGGEGVTIDLMGYELAGAPGSLDGINASASVRDITIRNGTVRGWGGDGIEGPDEVATLSDLQLILNGGNGIKGGSVYQVRHCTAYRSGGDGIVVSFSSIVESCQTRSNGGRGIVTAEGCVVTGCSAIGDTIGISISAKSTVSNCAVVSSQSGGGIVAGRGCTVTGCTAIDNVAGNGITVGTDCTVSGCTANQNTFAGISTSGNCTVTGCTVSLNAGNGIQLLGSKNRVTDNFSLSNGNGGLGSGIYTTTFDNRIEGNTVMSNDFGIFLDTATFPPTGNMVVRNYAQGNTTNYSNPASGNFIGTVVTSNAAMNAATNSLINISF
jgi:parallel beta-helix repeat protein